MLNQNNSGSELKMQFTGPNNLLITFTTNRKNEKVQKVWVIFASLREKQVHAQFEESNDFETITCIAI